MTKLLTLAGAMLVLHREFLRVLERMQDERTNMVAVLGPVSSGKSFLCNCIATCYERSFLDVHSSHVTTFASSDQEEPVTSGVDVYRCWESNFFVADVEGLGVRDINPERKLMAPIMVATQVLIYNVDSTRLETRR
jgi:ABC-type thiamine transport system ATPase subunit